MPGQKGMPNPQATRRQKKVMDPSSNLSERPGRNQTGACICKDCGAVHYHDRWYLREKLPEGALRDIEIHDVVCPACKQIRDHNPGGVLTLTGSFLNAHYDEIMNLINHEDHDAQGINPLEKIMEIDRSGDDCMEITTTNEFLVQRLGKAVHRAYSGDLEYKFGGSDVPVRVNWHRD